MAEYTPYYKSREVLGRQNFYERNRTAIWFYGIASVVIGLGIVPWIIGWITIIF